MAQALPGEMRNVRDIQVATPTLEQVAAVLEIESIDKVSIVVGIDDTPEQVGARNQPWWFEGLSKLFPFGLGGVAES